MEAIREYVKVENRRIVIDLPADFDAQDAEVIVLPVKMLTDLPATGQPESQKVYDFSDLQGRLEYSGDALASQRKLRDEW